MILYLDTSALVKRYFKEQHSKEIVQYWKDADEIATSSVAYSETLAAFYRKKREADLAERIFRKILEGFRRDWKSFVRIEVNDALNGFIDRVVDAHPIRGFDAIHLSSAIVLHERLPERLLFACFDHRLTAAAKTEGLKTYP